MLIFIYICLTTSTNYTFKQTFHLWKTRGSQCSFRLLMMGGVSPETCWASYKYGIIEFWYIVASCWIFLYEFYYDARIHEHQTLVLVCNLQVSAASGILTDHWVFWKWCVWYRAPMVVPERLSKRRCKTTFRQAYKYIQSLTPRRLISYTYGAPILDVSRSHTTTQHSR